MILFRTDGNSFVGIGHLMRCLSIADSARTLGHETMFITAGDEFQSIITSHGHRNVVLHSDYRYMDGEIDKVFSILEAQVLINPSVFLLDSYYVTNTYFTSLREFCKLISCKFVYIDDVLSFAYPVDIVVNYNIYGLNRKSEYRRLYADKGMSLPRLLLGTLYTPLRYDFQNVPDRSVKKKASCVLISTGGADIEHMTTSLIQEVSNYESDQLFHFIIGSMNKDRDKIYAAADIKKNIILHENVSNMAELMSSCDVAISAAGSTLYELCATQTPTVTYILADNQIPGAKEFSSYGVMENCGDVRKLGKGELANRLISSAIELLNNYEKRKCIAEKMKGIVDGYGAERVVEAILK